MDQSIVDRSTDKHNFTKFFAWAKAHLGRSTLRVSACPLAQYYHAHLANVTTDVAHVQVEPPSALLLLGQGKEVLAQHTLEPWEQAYVRALDEFFGVGRTLPAETVLRFTALFEYFFFGVDPEEDQYPLALDKLIEARLLKYGDTDAY